MTEEVTVEDETIDAVVVGINLPPTFFYFQYIISIIQVD